MSDLVLEGQTSIFDVLEDDQKYKLPFTVATGLGQWDFSECAYCGTAKGLNEGGSGPASEEFPSYRYQVCAGCSEGHRTMRPPMKLWTFKELP